MRYELRQSGDRWEVWDTQENKCIHYYFSEDAARDRCGYLNKYEAAA